MSPQNPSFHVAIIGGGAVGLISAWMLARAGAQVSVFERGEEIARQSSWAGGGILSPLPPWNAPESVWQLAAKSLEMYPALCQQMWEQTGVNPELINSGMLLLDTHEFMRGQTWCAEHALKAEMIAPNTYEPLLKKTESALRLPWVYQVRNPRLCQALEKQVRALGVKIHTQSQVQIQKQSSRAQLQVNGQMIAADAIVVAAGAWSGELLASVDWQLPIYPVAGQMLLLHGEPQQLRHIVLDDSRYLIPRQDGHILVGSTLENAGFDAQITPTVRSELYDLARSLLPNAKLSLRDHWIGFRPASPEGIPSIGRHPQLSNLYVNSGHFRYGITLAPASALQLIACIQKDHSFTLNSAATMAHNFANQ